MSKQTNVSEQITPEELELSEAEMVAYLEKEPSFFERHPDLLVNLRLPHESGPAISLVERQIDVLRDRNRKLENRIANLMQIAQDNETLEGQLHRISQSLIESEFDQNMFSAMNQLLASEFPSLTIRLCVYQAANDFPIEAFNIISEDELKVKVFRQIVQANSRSCIFVRGNRLDGLFPPEAGVQSAVAIPLRAQRNFGALVLGSTNENRFYEGMGTLFLEHLADLLSRKLKRLIA